MKKRPHEDDSERICAVMCDSAVDARLGDGGCDHGWRIGSRGV